MVRRRNFEKFSNVVAGVMSPNLFQVLRLVVFALCLVHVGIWNGFSQTRFLPSQQSLTSRAEYILSVEPLPESQYYELSISEYYGTILLDNINQASSNAFYRWFPSSSLPVFSGVRYITTLSYYSENQGLIKTKASEVFIEPQIENGVAPPLFFSGNSIEFDSNVQPTSQIQQIIDLILSAASGRYADSPILLRGHASFISDSFQARQIEQVDLLQLSQQRALRILDILRRAGINVTRINIESVGGSEQLSEEQEGKWKNRRVEIFFSDYLSVTSGFSSDTAVQSNRTSIDTANSSFSEPQQRTSFFYDSQNEVEDSMQEQPFTPNRSSNFSRNDQAPVLPSYTGDSYFRNVQPWPDVPIVGNGVLTVEEASSFIRFYVPTLEKTYTDRIVSIYLQEADREQINSDVAIAQMLLETDFLRFLGKISRKQFSFARMENIGSQSGATFFRTETIGVRAHIQQLKGLATNDILRGELVDPGYTYLDGIGLLGSSPTVKSLSGRWSSDPEYGDSILRILRKMFDFANAR